MEPAVSLLKGAVNQVTEWEALRKPIIMLSQTPAH